MESRKLHSEESKVPPAHSTSLELSRLQMCSVPVVAPSTGRYFDRFYESFRIPSCKQFERMLNAVLQREQRCRWIIGYVEGRERSALVHSFGYRLSPSHPRMLSYSSLGVVSEEVVQRRLLESRFFDMLLEACVVEERLRRVKILLPLEDANRRKIESLEVQHRILSMRAEKNRMMTIATNSESSSHVRSAAPPHGRTSEAILLLQIEEKESRLKSKREEFLNFKSLIHCSAISIQANQHAQDRHQLLSHPLGREEFNMLSAEEAHKRTSIMQESRVASSAIAAEEVIAFCKM